jgi:uncharacterized protein (TIGR02246 family)
MKHLRMISFRIAAVSVAALFIALAADAQSSPASSEEAAVRSVVLHEIDGWTKYNAAQVASCFADNITWQNPFGVRIHTRAQLETFLTNLFQRPGYRSAKDTSAPRIIDIHILSPTSAAVWSEEKSDGQLDDQSGKPMKPRYSHYLEVLVKQGDKWLVTDSIIMDEYSRP